MLDNDSLLLLFLFKIAFMNNLLYLNLLKDLLLQVNNMISVT